MSLRLGSWFHRATSGGKGLFLTALLLPAGGPAWAQLTRAERSEYRETSSYADVLGFLDSLQQRSRDIAVGTLGYSAEGRRIPYVLVARPLVSTPAEAHRAGKPIVYLQADIHAGEVEGKEAVQALLRDITVGPLRFLLGRVILLTVPIYNPDGNELMAAGEVNRPGQNGPALVGQNPNGQGLNLNRDYIKMEAPETRGAASLINGWDPELFLDLHTTNGSYHGYVLTYSPGLNPNPNPAVRFVRERLLPEVRERMQQRYRQPTFSYGNFRNQNPDSLAQGWETYDARPRFGTNWMGLRGRLAVLSEGYSNADFRTRILATYNFVREILSFAAEHHAAIASLIDEADRQRPDSVAVRSVLGPPVVQGVIAEITQPAGEGNGGFAQRRRTGVYRTIRMPVFDRFVASRKEAVPAGYLIPARLEQVVELLRRQGVTVSATTQPWRASVEVFAVESLTVATLFEGHRTVQAEGSWSRELRDSTVSGRWYLVSTDQPLGTLAAYLLEPASEDGVVTWNLIDRELRPGSSYPILRLRARPAVPATLLP
jgi:zinc carboxypeptidase